MYQWVINAIAQWNVSPEIFIAQVFYPYDKRTNLIAFYKRDRLIKEKLNQFSKFVNTISQILIKFLNELSFNLVHHVKKILILYNFIYIYIDGIHTRKFAIYFYILQI